MTYNRGKGAAIKWLRDNSGYSGNECLIWPFSRNHETGYGSFGYLGKMHYAHRFMCELVRGPAPTPGMYTTHSCGNGHGGCVNPMHLAWDTSAGNASDRVFHGRQKKRGEPRFKLTQAQADQIRALKGVRSQYDIAREFNISRENVARIHRGIAWTGTAPRRDIRYTAEDRAKIAMRARQMHKEGVTYDEIGKTFDITRSYASMLARGVAR